MRRIALSAAVATAAGVISAFVAIAPSASAGPVGDPPSPDTSVAVPVGALTDMVVDPQARRVFYAGEAPLNGRGNGHGGGVIVSNYDGSAMADIKTTTATSRLTLGPDGKIYALEERGQIAVIDPQTLAVTHHVIPAAVRCPSSIAFAGNQMWLSYYCGTGSGQGLATFDPSDDTAVVYPMEKHYLYSRPLIRTRPNHPDELVASELTGFDQLALIDVSGPTPTVLAQTPSMESHIDINAIPFVVSPDGETLFAASQGLHGVGTFSADELARGTVYESEVANRVALDASGTRIAAASTSDCGIDTFNDTTIAPVRNYPGGLDARPNEIGCPTALAWAGSSLLAVYTGQFRGWPLLHVLNGPMQAPTTLQFTGPKTVARATPLTVTGQLVGLPNTSVIITKRDLSGAHALGTVTTDGDGRFHVPDLPRVGGQNTYVARYLGDQIHRGVATAAVVNVSRGTVPLTVRTDRSTYNLLDTAKISIHLAPHDIKWVQLWIASPGPQHWLTTLNVDAHGNASYSYRQLHYNTNFVVKFFGDYYYNPRSVGIIARTRAKVTQTVTGNYTMSGQYMEFCCNAEINGSVSPTQSDDHVVLEVQRFLLGQWISAPAPSGYDVEYNGGGGERAFFMRSRLGYYRVRTVFHSNYWNVGNVSPWAYIKFPGWNIS